VLTCAKRSVAYRTLHARFAGARPPRPSESWNEGELTYLVFDLVPEGTRGSMCPLALFVVRREPTELVLVRLITPTNDSSAVTLTDLYTVSGDVNNGDL
jgi:hypothetical protein